jgi:hypothetical protein
MPDECKIGVEVNPKVVLGKPTMWHQPVSVGSRGFTGERATARHDARVSSKAFASFRSSVSKPSVNQP